MYPSPVTVAELQLYLKDSSTDLDLLDLYGMALSAATSAVYHYLDRDYTPGAIKDEVFWGNDSYCRRLRHTAEVIILWTFRSRDGIETVADHTSLHLFADGGLIISSGERFQTGYEHRIRYTQPLAPFCPNAVKQVILESAAEIFEESKHGAGSLGIGSYWTSGNSLAERTRYFDLSGRHRDALAPFRRFPV